MYILNKKIVKKYKILNLKLKIKTKAYGSTGVVRAYDKILTLQTSNEVVLYTAIHYS